MLISKDHERGTYYVQCYYRDWTGGAQEEDQARILDQEGRDGLGGGLPAPDGGQPDMTLNAFLAMSLLQSS